TQALLDALTIRRAKGRIAGLTVAICGDISHSRVARSNILLLNALGSRVRVVAPSTLLPAGIAQMSVEVFNTMKEGLAGADVVMHPGPMNRGVEIASEIADGPQSVIQEQVEMGVAVRMAVMEALLDPRRNPEGAAAGIL